MRPGNRRKKIFFSALFLAGFLLAGLQAAPLGASAAAGERRVILVLLDQVSLGSLTEAHLPNLEHIMAGGAIALLNTSTAGARTPENAYATLGAGRAAAAGPAGLLAYGAGERLAEETAGAVYARRTGWQAAPGSVVLPGLAEVLAYNKKAGGGRLGALGENLHLAGKKAAILGNADLAERARRPAILIAMDTRGLAPLGSVGAEITGPRESGLLSRSTDYTRLWEAYRRFQGEASLLVLDLGDNGRLEEAAVNALPGVAAEENRRCLQEADAFLGRLAASLGREDLLLIASPAPSRRAQEDGELLTPLLAYGAGIRPGLLTSGSTRQMGLVALSDLAPTVLAYLELPADPVMSGRPFWAAPSPQPLPYLLTLERRAIAAHQARPILVKGFILLEIAVLAVAVLALMLKSKPRFLPAWLVFQAAAPLGFLLASLFHPADLAAQVVLSLGATTLLSLLATAAWPHDYPARLVGVALATALALVLDLLAGSPLMGGSVLGFDPMGGARYYGIGNEYMGVLIGAALLGGAGLLQRAKAGRRALQNFLLLSLAALAMLISWPSLGANAGGLFTSVIAFLACWVGLSGKRPTFRLALGMAASAVLLLGLVAAVDATRSVSVQSHLGRAAGQVAQDGIYPLLDLASRKLAMNLKLIRYTVWSRVFLLMLLAWGVMLYRPPGFWQRLRREKPYLAGGMAACLLASLVALTANDSGIVAAATSMLYAVNALVMEALERGERNV